MCTVSNLGSLCSLLLELATRERKFLPCGGLASRYLEKIAQNSRRSLHYGHSMCVCVFDASHQQRAAKEKDEGCQLLLRREHDERREGITCKLCHLVVRPWPCWRPNVMLVDLLTPPDDVEDGVFILGSVVWLCWTLWHGMFLRLETRQFGWRRRGEDSYV